MAVDVALFVSKRLAAAAAGLLCLALVQLAGRRVAAVQGSPSPTEIRVAISR